MIPSHRMFSVIGIALFALAAASPLVQAWVPVAGITATSKSITTTPARMRDTALFETSSSRRDWLSGISAAVVGGIVVGNSNVAAAAAPPKAACDASVSVWQNPTNGRKVYLLGTAHISSQSAILAGNLVDEIRPDAVYLELDARRVVGGRYGVLPDGSVEGSEGQLLTIPPPESYDTSSSGTSTTEIAAPTKRKANNSPFDLKQRALQAGSAAVGGAIKGMYNQMEDAGFQTGEEFSMAIREGKKVGSKIVLGDRDVQETLRRLTEALAATDLNVFLNPDSELEQMMKQLAPTNSAAMINPNNEQLNDSEFRQEFSQYVETMKAKDNVKLLMEELKKLAPELYTAMVAERDLYMANGIDILNQFPAIVAVMGIAHVDGVEHNLQKRGWKPVTQKCPKQS